MVSNNGTRSIKIMNVLLLTGLVAIFACDGPAKTYYRQGPTIQHTEILGGKPVKASTAFANKVIYLAIGVEWTKTMSGMSVQHNKICTASAISKRVLLTAAHCVAGMEPSQVNAVLSLNPFKDSKVIPTDWVKVETIFIHKDYQTKPEVKNDVALVQLSADLDDVRISKIADVSQTNSAMQIISIGYGLTEVEGEAPENPESLLNYVLKPVLDYKVENPKITVEQFDKTGICSGDSGSPGFIFDTVKKEFFVIGIASYVTHPKNKIGEEPTAQSCHGYGVYMSAIVFSKWINESIKLL